MVISIQVLNNNKRRQKWGERERERVRQFSCKKYRTYSCGPKNLVFKREKHRIYAEDKEK
jgi:hypothetical protein